MFATPGDEGSIDGRPPMLDVPVFKNAKVKLQYAVRTLLPSSRVGQMMGERATLRGAWYTRHGGQAGAGERAGAWCT